MQRSSSSSSGLAVIVYRRAGSRITSLLLWAAVSLSEKRYNKATAREHCRRRCSRRAGDRTASRMALAIFVLLCCCCWPAGGGSIPGAAPPPTRCKLPDCANPMKHDQCRVVCGPRFRPNCTYCPANPDPLQCSKRCALHPPGPPRPPSPGRQGTCAGYYSQNRGLVKAPTSMTARAEWWKHVLMMRQACQANSNRSIFDVEELKSTATNYVQPQMHPFDKLFYDPVARNYTVDKWLDDVEQRYGGVDSVLIWPTWPNIGVDSRNQFEMFAALPGGLPALRRAIAQLHARQVKVLLPYNPWDQFTRRPMADDAEMLSRLRSAVGSDGINADSTHVLPESFYSASPGGAIEPEHEGDPPMRTWHTLGWGCHNANFHGLQHGPFPDTSGPHFVPGADFYKAAYDSRWMTHCQERNALNRTGGLLTAYFNAMGYESWENLWGAWNGITARDSELLRRVASIERHFGALGLLTSQAWEPHTPDVTSHDGEVYGSKFPLKGQVVWLIVNARAVTATATVIIPTGLPHISDCYAGSVFSNAGRNSSVSVEIEGSAIGCVFASATPPASTDTAFLTNMKQMTQGKPLQALSPQWHYLNQSIVAQSVCRKPREATDMITIPSTPHFHFHVREARGSVFDKINSQDGYPASPGCGEQWPWEHHPQSIHDRVLAVPSFRIDRWPVTNGKYAKYLHASGYSPTDKTNWLTFWNTSGATPTFPAGYATKPVVGIGLSEARAYCAFYAKRLPSEIEWAYSAQGLDNRSFPWGNANDGSRYPSPWNDTQSDPVPDDVNAHPSGVSPFGVEDCVGNVWQFTTTFEDARNRVAILRGSSRYANAAEAAESYYFPPALELSRHQRYLLMDDSFERAATIGFRCAADVALAVKTDDDYKAATTATAATTLLQTESNDLCIVGWAEVFTVAPSNMSVKTWSWFPNRSAEIRRNPVLALAFNGTTDCRPDPFAAPGHERLVVTSDGGGVAVVNRRTKRLDFATYLTNAHSADFLPGNRLVAVGPRAAYLGPHGKPQMGGIAIFDLNNVSWGRNAAPIFRNTSLAAHGTTFDRKRGVIFAVQDSTLFELSLDLTVQATHALPGPAAHDLYPVLDPHSRYLALTTHHHCWLWDMEQNIALLHPIAELANSTSLKSVSTLPDGSVAWLKEDGSHYPKGFPPPAHFRSHTIHRGLLKVNPMSGWSTGNISLPATWLPAYKARWISRIEQPRCPFCPRKKTIKSFNAISVVEVGQLIKTDNTHSDPHSVVATARSLGYDAVGLFAYNCQQWHLLDEYIAAAGALDMRIIANLESHSGRTLRKYCSNFRNNATGLVDWPSTTQQLAERSLASNGTLAGYLMDDFIGACALQRDGNQTLNKSESGGWSFEDMRAFTASAKAVNPDFNFSPVLYPFELGLIHPSSFSIGASLSDDGTYPLVLGGPVPSLFARWTGAATEWRLSFLESSDFRPALADIALFCGRVRRIIELDGVVILDQDLCHRSTDVTTYFGVKLFNVSVPRLSNPSAEHVLNISLRGLAAEPFTKGGKNEKPSINVWEISATSPTGMTADVRVTADVMHAPSVPPSPHLFAGSNARWAYPKLWDGAMFCWKQGDHLLDGATRQPEIAIYKGLMQSLRHALNSGDGRTGHGSYWSGVLPAHFGGLTNWDTHSPWSRETETAAHVKELLLIDGYMADGLAIWDPLFNLSSSAVFKPTWSPWPTEYPTYLSWPSKTPLLKGWFAQWQTSSPFAPASRHNVTMRMRIQGDAADVACFRRSLSIGGVVVYNSNASRDCVTVNTSVPCPGLSKAAARSGITCLLFCTQPPQINAVDQTLIIHQTRRPTAGSVQLALEAAKDTSGSVGVGWSVTGDKPGVTKWTWQSGVNASASPEMQTAAAIDESLSLLRDCACPSVTASMKTDDERAGLRSGDSGELDGNARALSCSLNGKIVAQRCECRSWWTGSQCQFLNLQPAKSLHSGIFQSSVSTWGASVIRHPVSQLLHAHVAEFSNQCGVSTWTTNSLCAHYTAIHPHGPFARVGVADGQFCHNPSATVLPDGQWLLHRIGQGRPLLPAYTNCSRGATKGDAPVHWRTLRAPTNFTSVLSAAGPGGPWFEHKITTLTSQHWPTGHLDNPAPLPPHNLKKGQHGYQVMFAARDRYRGCPMGNCSQLGMARASTWLGPYVLDSVPICHGARCHNGSTPGWETFCEDPYHWIEDDGTHHALCNSQDPRLEISGMHAFSLSGAAGSWHFSSEPAYNTTLRVVCAVKRRLLPRVNIFRVFFSTLSCWYGSKVQNGCTGTDLA